MSYEEFLYSTLRQILVLDRLHSDYFKNNLRAVVGEVIDSIFGGSSEEDEQQIYVESLADLF